MNTIQLIGKIVRKPELKKTEADDRYRNFDMEVLKNFRDSNGQYTTEIFQVYLWKGMAIEVVEARKIDDLVAIRGRLEIREGSIEIIAEVVEFLSKKN